MRGYRAACAGWPRDYAPADRAALAALPFPSALRVYREIAEDSL